MAAHVQIRRAAPRDFGALGEVFPASVREGAGQYTEAQRAAWSPDPRSGEAWSAHLGAQSVWLAETESRPLGFLTLAAEGYIDLAYILPEVQGRGLFRRLCGALENEAFRLGIHHLRTDASLHAKGPFEASSFTATRAGMAVRSGERLKRFRMEKTLVG